MTETMRGVMMALHGRRRALALIAFLVILWGTAVIASEYVTRPNVVSVPSLEGQLPPSEWTTVDAGR